MLRRWGQATLQGSQGISLEERDCNSDAFCSEAQCFSGKERGPDRDQRSRENPRKLWKEIYPKDESIWTKDWYLTHFLVRVGDLSQSVSSVAQSCLTLCDPMDCNTPGFPVHHQLLELIQTHIHSVSDTIQSSHPLRSPSPPAFKQSQHQGQMNQLFISGSQSIGVSASASVLPTNIQDWSLLSWISLQSKGFSRVFSNTTVQKY